MVSWQSICCEPCYHCCCLLLLVPASLPAGICRLLVCMHAAHHKGALNALSARAGPCASPPLPSDNPAAASTRQPSAQTAAVERARTSSAAAAAAAAHLKNKCLPGSFFNATSAGCQLCPPGHFTDVLGALRCVVSR